MMRTNTRRTGGNPLWPCPRKCCDGFLVAKTRKNSNSQYAVCETRRPDDPDSCLAFYNINKRHWGINLELARTCDWCEGDTGESPSIGVPCSARATLRTAPPKLSLHLFTSIKFCCRMLIMALSKTDRELNATELDTLPTNLSVEVNTWHKNDGPKGGEKLHLNDMRIGGNSQ